MYKPTDDDLRMMIPAPTLVGAATHFGALGRLSATQAAALEAPAALCTHPIHPPCSPHLHSCTSHLTPDRHADCSLRLLACPATPHAARPTNPVSRSMTTSTNARQGMRTSRSPSSSRRPKPAPSPLAQPPRSWGDTPARWRLARLAHRHSADPKGVRAVRCARDRHVQRPGGCSGPAEHFSCHFAAAAC